MCCSQRVRIVRPGEKSASRLDRHAARWRKALARASALVTKVLASRN